VEGIIDRGSGAFAGEREEQGHRRVYRYLQHIQEHGMPQTRKTGGLSNFDNNFASGTTSQDLVVCAEHVVKLMHRIDGWFDFACGEGVRVRGQFM